MDLEGLEGTFIVLSARAWEELAALRFWLRDAITLRWLEACATYNNDPQRPLPADCLRLDYPERDAETMKRLRAVYHQVGWDTCIYTGRRLTGEVQMDHLLPFSRFPVNYFWNIVPTTSVLNQSKGNKLPPLVGDIADRYKVFLATVLKAGAPTVANDLHSTWRQHFQHDTFCTEPRELRDSLWSIVNQTHAKLESSGVEVWQIPATNAVLRSTVTV